MAVLEPEVAESPSIEEVPAATVEAPTVDWEKERSELTLAWEQERKQWLAERDELSARWQQERSDLQQELSELGARLNEEKEDLRQRLSALESQAGDAELELELIRKQANDLQDQLEAAHKEIESETHQVTRLQDELAEAMRRVESAEGRHEELQAAQQEVQNQLQQAQERIQELETQNEELDLLREDLEETIVDRRREVKTLRASEAEARAYAEECKLFRVEAEQRVQNAEGEQERLRRVHEQELKQLEELVERAHARQEELVAQAEAAKQSVNQEALKEAERRHLEAERQLIQVRGELDALKKDGGDRERLERRCLLLENDLKAANQELMALERTQSRWETEKQQLTEELTRLKSAPAPAPTGGAPVDEAELRQWKIRSEELREGLRKQRTENERLQERIEVLIKAKELEEKQRKEVESRLRTALRIQARQQQGY